MSEKSSEPNKSSTKKKRFTFQFNLNIHKFYLDKRVIGKVSNNRATAADKEKALKRISKS